MVPSLCMLSSFLVSLGKLRCIVGSHSLSLIYILHCIVFLEFFKLLATFFFKPRRGNALRTMCGTCSEDVAYPLNPPSSQATRSHPGKAKSYEPTALNEKMLPMKRKKSITISHTQYGTTPIPTPFKQKRKNEDVRNRGDQHKEEEKVNKFN